MNDPRLAAILSSPERVKLPEFLGEITPVVFRVDLVLQDDGGYRAVLWCSWNTHTGLLALENEFEWARQWEDGEGNKCTFVDFHPDLDRETVKALLKDRLSEYGKILWRQGI